MNRGDPFATFKRGTEKGNFLPREEKIRETIEISKETFLREEAGKMLSYPSFLYTQLRLIRKRWWLAAGCAAVILAGSFCFIWRSLLPAFLIY